jgi:hypothetical protein
VRFEYDKMVLWHGTADAPAPTGDVSASTDNQATVTIVVAVQPPSPNNRVQIRYRVNDSTPATVAAVPGRQDLVNKVQYFSAKLPAFSAGDHVDYVAIARSPAGQVPSPDVASGFPASFKVVGAVAQSEGVPASRKASSSATESPSSSTSDASTAALSKAQLLALAKLAKSTAAAIQHANPGLGKILAEKIGAQRKAAVLGSLKGSSQQLNVAIQKTDFSPLSPATVTIEQAITSGLAAQKADKALSAEAARLIRKLQRSGKLAKVPDVNTPIAQIPLFQPELNQAALYQLTDCAKLADAKAERLVAMAGSPALVDDDMLASLVADKTFTAAEASILGLLLSLCVLTGGSADLAIEIKPSVNTLQDVATISVAQWLQAITRSKATLPEGLTADDYAAALRRAATNLYPTEALHALMLSIDAQQLTQAVAAVTPLVAKNSKIFGVEFEQLDTSEVGENRAAVVKSALQTLQMLINQHPGFGLADVLNSSGSPVDKVAAISTRLNVLSKLRTLNPDHEFLGLDYTEGSADRETLQTSGLSAADLHMAIANLKAVQRVHAMTKEADHTNVIMAAGYASASAIAMDDPDEFERKTGFPREIARHYHEKATSTLSKASHAVISAIDAYDGPFHRTRAGNVRPSIKDHLKAIPGFSDLFGTQDYCNCAECQSILGAAAYFVDLMTFVEENLTGRVFQGKKANDRLNLKVRRPDLWTLPLTCDNTNNLVSYLEIINPTLENYIAGQDLGRHPLRAITLSRKHRIGPKAALHEVHPPQRGAEQLKKIHAQGGRSTERPSAAALVYENILSKSRASFQQPFVLPLVKLDTYLEHFSTPRVNIARALAADQPVIVKAALKISDVLYQQLKNANPDHAFLTKVYGTHLSFSGTAAHVNALDVQSMLKPTGFSRPDFETAVKTLFVTKNGAYKIEIRSEKKSAESIQNDAEYVHGLSADALHRLYRFTRLLHATPWSISELDMILVQLNAAASPDGLNEHTLHRITQLLQLRDRWSLPVDQSCALWSAIPIEPKEGNLFDRLFNIAALQALDPKLPVSNVKFIHAAFSTSGAAHIVPISPTQTPAPTSPPISHHNMTQRIVAGLQVHDADLISLISGLAGPLLEGNLAGPPQSDLGFVPSLNNLTLLYRHANLARLLNLRIPQLFQLIQLAGLAHRYVGSIDDLMSLLDFYDWYQTGGYQLDDLGTITQGPVLNSARYPQAPTLAAKLALTVAADRSLEFSDKVFTSLLGVTDAESQQMIAGNSTLFQAVPDAATPTFRLTSALRPGTALQFSDTVFAFLPGVTEQKSQQIVAANPTVFTSVANATPRTLQLSATFGPETAITIPNGISLSSADAKAALVRYSAGLGGAASALLRYHPIEVIPSSLSGLLGVDAATLTVLILLTGVDLSSAQIFQALQAGAAPAAVASATPAPAGPEPATAAPTTPVPAAAAPATPTPAAAASATPAAAASAPAAPDPLTSLIQQIVPLKVLVATFGFSVDDLNYIQQNGQLFGIANFNTVSVANVRKLSVYAKFAAGLAGNPTGAGPLRDVLAKFSGASLFSKADPRELATVLGIDPKQVHSLLPHLRLPATAPEALTQLSAIAGLYKSLGIGGEALSSILSDDYSEQTLASIAVLGAFRAQFHAERDFLDSSQPFDDRILEQQRDALTDYLLTWNGYKFSSLDDLYNYFLLDVQLEGCMQTSWVVAAISSVQLYVYRCLMNLEQDQRDPHDPEHIHVTVSASAAEEWEWRQNFRVWQANREVFLYPESYILPELRDDKTPLFEDLESVLLQQPINDQNVLDAYSSYLSGFDQLSKLKIAGSYHDIDTESSADVLHLFGVTPADPPTYFYRTVENASHGQTETDRAVTYTPWVPVNLQIHCREVAPVVYLGRLFVFWTQITTAPTHLVANASSIFDGYKHHWGVKYSSLRLDGTWTPPQQLAMTDSSVFPLGDGVVPDPLEAPIVKSMEEGMSPQLAQDYALQWEIVFGLPSEINRDTWTDRLLLAIAAEGGSKAQTDLTKYQATLVPRYDSAVHATPVDGYTLTGFQWDRIYPTAGSDHLAITGRNFVLQGSSVDFYNQIVLPGKNSTVAQSSQTVLCSKDGLLFTGVQHNFGLERYPWCTIVAEYEHIEKLHMTVESASLDSVLNQGLYKTLIASFPVTSDVAMINSSVTGAITDAIIDADGDQLLLQGSVRPGDYVMKRLGTTLGENLCRALFVNCVDGLLNIDTQSALEEPGAPLLIRRNVQNDVVVGKMDFTGAMGTYFREIFFHVPFLIASQLNSQQNFEAAQKWYRYIFDPTATEEDLPSKRGDAHERDTVWRYIEFRNQDVPSLRQILTDAAAIEAYEQNPFNPHAIARLRLSAYQKCTVMNYIDNLINWGDSLFTEFQMETVNEATLLYVQALETLGPRPEDVGDCGEMNENERTYERIAPLVKKGSEFLTEMETYTYARSASARALPKLRPIHQFTLPHAVANYHFKEAANTCLRRVSGARRFQPVEEHESVARGVAHGVTHGVEHQSEIRTQSTSAAGTKDRRSPKVEAEHGVAHPYHWKGMHSSSRSPSGGRARKTPGRKGAAKTVGGRASRFAWSVARHIVPVFCVPPNADLLAYWDIVEDRLYKIRHGMDITGAVRQLSLFAPPINPLLLVEAKAEGLSLDSVLNATSGDAPPYRFIYLIDKAKQFAAQVQSLGNSLLSALEKNDAQQLEVMRVTQQQNILAMTTSTKQAEIDAASNAIDNLNAQLDTAQYRHDYFQGLVEGGLTTWENLQADSSRTASGTHLSSSLMVGSAAVLHLLPDLGSPFAMKYGGVELGNSTSAWSEVLERVATVAEVIASAAGMQGGFERRSNSWQHEVDMATKDLAQINTQLVGANMRLTIANKALDIHNKTIEQEQQVADFYTSRFSNIALYTWLASKMKTTYRQAYNCAFAMAQLAQQAYQFERNDDTMMFIGPTYWSQAQSGLLAGELLLGDLQRMEQRFLETNYRTPEMTQSFSMMQIAPAALLNLRQNATCKFDIPELAFDLIYPGQYCRKIKAVRLTIPCVAGPFTNVGATLTLTNSQLRLTSTSTSLTPIQLKHSVMIATSSAQNDAGVFEFDFRDERYMPFEGAGAISSWTVELPDAFRNFDYQTMADVIVHISYTAQYDGALRQSVEQKNGAIAKALRSQPLGRLFSLYQEFPSVLYRLVHSAANTPVTMSIGANLLPFFIAASAIQVTKAALLLRTAASQGTVENFALTIDGTSVTSFQPDPAMANLPSADVSSVFSAGLFGDHAIAVANAGNLAPAPAQPSDPSSLDDTKLLDVMLYLEYQVGAT